MKNEWNTEDAALLRSSSQRLLQELDRIKPIIADKIEDLDKANIDLRAAYFAGYQKCKANVEELAAYDIKSKKSRHMEMS